MLGFGKGKRLTLTCYDMPGRISILSKIVNDLNRNILTIAIEDIDVMGIFRILLRVENCNLRELEKKLDECGFRIETIS